MSGNCLLGRKHAVLATKQMPGNCLLGSKTNVRKFSSWQHAVLATKQLSGNCFLGSKTNVRKLSSWQQNKCQQIVFLIACSPLGSKTLQVTSPILHFFRASDTLHTHRKLPAVSDLATMLGDTKTLPSQAAGCEQRSDDAWRHENVTIASCRL